MRGAAVTDGVAVVCVVVCAVAVSSAQTSPHMTTTAINNATGQEHRDFFITPRTKNGRAKDLTGLPKTAWQPKSFGNSTCYPLRFIVAGCATGSASVVFSAFFRHWQSQWHTNNGQEYDPRTLTHYTSRIAMGRQPTRGRSHWRGQFHFVKRPIIVTHIRPSPPKKGPRHDLPT